MYAIVQTGGKQYKVEEGQILEVEKLDAKAGDKIELEVLLKSEGENILTSEQAAKTKVTAEVLGTTKTKKLVVYKYKAKKNVRKKSGHRQSYSRIKILSIA